jgi:hypothetical protein
MLPQNPGRGFIAMALIAIGLMSLMGINLMWPMFILVPGLIMLGIALFGGSVGAATFAIPGALTAGTGAILFIQNLTNYWESWAYAWTLYPAFLGLGFMVMAQQFADSSLERVGRWFVRGSMIGFVGFALFFEIVIGISGGLSAPGALLLIGVGLFLMLRGESLGIAGSQLSSGGHKAKVKPKRRDDVLFTGPIVYGTRASAAEIEQWRQRQAAADAASAAEQQT